MLRLLLAMLLLATPAAAQSDRPVRMVSGFAAGGASDLISRLMAEALTPLLGARVVVENRTGANGVIGAEVVAHSPPDGFTIYQCPMSTMAIAPQLQGANLPVDPGVALAPIANAALSTYALMVAANSPYRSVEDVLAAARRQPGQLAFGSAGVGSAQHLAGELLKQLGRVDIVHIPYRGATPAIVDILGGRVAFTITNIADATRQLTDGALRLVALADDAPNALFPDAPPISRTLPGFNVTGWFGFCGPRGMSAEVVGRIAGAIQAALAQDALQRRLIGAGLTPRFEGPDALAARLAADRRQWLGVIQAVNIRAE